MKSCIFIRTVCKICCFLVCTTGFLVGRKACAQKVATYLMDTVPSATSYEPYRISFSTSSKAVTVSFPLRERHAFNIRAEYFRTASVPKLNEKVWDIKADWKFRSVPVTASYTYAFPSVSPRLVPILGAGLSAHIYKMTHATGYGHQTLIPGLAASLVTSDLNLHDSFGVKYGAELSLGIRTELTPHLFLLAQGRYRYINDCSSRSAISPYRRGSLNILDFSLDIGFGF